MQSKRKWRVNKILETKEARKRRAIKTKIKRIKIFFRSRKPESRIKWRGREKYKKENIKN